jgi:hypothetical protein
MQKGKRQLTNSRELNPKSGIRKDENQSIYHRILKTNKQTNKPRMTV